MNSIRTTKSKPMSDPRSPDTTDAAWSWADKGGFGIVANVCEPDRVFRLGAKAWLAGGMSGDGWERFRWIALSRAPHQAEKYSPLWRFRNFRAAWVPPPLTERVCAFRGSRAEMEAAARDLERRAMEFRKERPNRAYGRPNPAGIKEVAR
jgi:hypothetical protein